MKKRFNYTRRGKIYLICGLVAIGYALYIDNGLSGVLGGLFISWSYWYWWRNIVFKKKLENERKAKDE